MRFTGPVRVPPLPGHLVGTGKRVMEKEYSIAPEGVSWERVLSSSCGDEGWRERRRPLLPRARRFFAATHRLEGESHQANALLLIHEKSGTRHTPCCSRTQCRGPSTTPPSIGFTPRLKRTQSRHFDMDSYVVPKCRSGVPRIGRGRHLAWSSP